MVRTYEFVITAKDAATMAQWVATRGGLIRWSCIEIGNPAGDTITPATTPDGQPGNPGCKPSWRYGESRPIGPEQIEVTCRSPLHMPFSDRRTCEYCNGYGVRGLAELRPYGHTDLGQLPDHWKRLGADYFVCNNCHGHGYELERATVRGTYRREFWGGLTMSHALLAKVEKLGCRVAESYGFPVDQVDHEIAREDRRLCTVGLYRVESIGSLADWIAAH